MHTFSGPVEHAIAHIEEAAVHNMPEEQQRWYAIKIFERDDKVLEQLKIDATVMGHIEEDIKAAEKELDDDAESIITNERYVYIAQIIKGCYKQKKAKGELSASDKIDRIVTNRWLGLPIFALVIAILVFAKVNNDGFMILWRYFAWANQTLSLFAFLCITAWMFENGKGKWAWIPMIPGCFYAFICVTYIANAHIGFNIPWTPSYIIGVVCAAAYVVGCCVYGKKRAAKLALK